MWTDYLAGVTRDTTPALISIKVATGCESARGTAPSEMDQLSPHVSNDVARVGLEDSPALLNCTRIPFIRREQEDQVIGQFTTPGLASNKPAKFCLFLCDTGLLGRVRPEGVVVPHVHIKPYRHREAKTKPAAVALAPNKLHKGGVRSIDQRPSEVWSGRIAHTHCLGASSLSALVRSLKAPFRGPYRFDSVFGPDLALSERMTASVRLVAAVGCTGRSRCAEYGCPISPCSEISCRRGRS